MQFVARIFKDDNVAAFDLALRQKRQRASARRKDKLIDQQIVADKDRVLHRTGGYRNRLQNKGHPENRHYKRDDKRFEIFARGRFWRPSRFLFGFGFFLCLCLCLCVVHR